MLLTTPKKLRHQDNALLAQTGVTKAGYLLRRQSSSALKQWRWETTFLILNDHTLSYCSEKKRFSRPDGTLLLTSSTRVYNQDGDEAVIRIETGLEVLFLKGRDVSEIKDWKKAIHGAVVFLSQLARGQFAVKRNGKVKDHFLMLHRECITSHPSSSDFSFIDKVYPITSELKFSADDKIIKITDGDSTTSFAAKNNIEFKNFAYALNQIISSPQNSSKLIISPPQLPLHSGTLLLLDPSSMKWTKKYLVMTDDRIYIHGHKRVGVDAIQEHKLTPNTMMFSTTLKPYSFEVVLFSESLHLAAESETQRSEWLLMIHNLILKSSYDMTDPLQAASFEREMNDYPIVFQSSTEPGVILERRGNWAIAAVISPSLSRKVSRGSMLSKVEGKSVVLNGFDAVASTLSLWKAPLHLSFYLSPQKMGWLQLLVMENRKTWWRASKVVSWENVYATVSTGVLTLYTVLKDGKSKKHEMGLYGSGVGLLDSELVFGKKHCFRIVNGIQSIILQAACQEDMMDWSTSIAHGISMENGGGLLLDKAKQEHAPNTTIEQSHAQSVVRVDDHDGMKSSIIFAKQLEETAAAKRDKIKSSIQTRSKSLDVATMPMVDVLKRSFSTDLTELNHVTFKTLEPADLSETMEVFANNFFTDAHKRFQHSVSKDELPVQALKRDSSYESIGTVSSSECLDIPWLEIDKASSTAGSVALSDEDIVDKHLDLNASDTHMNAKDFKTLLRYNEERLS